MSKESIDGERLVQLRRVHGGHAAYVTRIVRSFTESLEAGDIAETSAQIDACAGAVSAFRFAHDKYMSLATVCDPGKLSYFEDHYLEVIAQYKMAQIQFDTLKVDTLSSMDPWILNQKTVCHSKVLIPLLGQHPV